MDLAELSRLYEAYRWRDMTVAQAYVESWDLQHLTEAEAEANEAGKELLRAVHHAWPEIHRRLTNGVTEGKDDAPQE